MTGSGTEVAGQLLVTAGQIPHRLHSEAAFAALCGISPVPASPGKTNRHRLNRGGDRQGNNAIWRIAMTRMSHVETTSDLHRQTRSPAATANAKPSEPSNDTSAARSGEHSSLT